MANIHMSSSSPIRCRSVVGGQSSSFHETLRNDPEPWNKAFSGMTLSIVRALLKTGTSLDVFII